MKVFALGLMMLVSAPTVAFAAPPAGASGGDMFTSPGSPRELAQQVRKRDAILAVRKEGLKLQSDDGGKLTDEHRAYLQAKLNAIRAGNY